MPLVETMELVVCFKILLSHMMRNIWCDIPLTFTKVLGSCIDTFEHRKSLLLADVLTACMHESI